MESVKVAIRINGKYANEKTVRQINDRMAAAERERRVWETPEINMQRRIRKYVQMHNITHATQTVNGVKEQTKQRHYSKRVLHTWEKNDTQKRSTTRKEVCVLYENGVVMVRTAYVKREIVTRTIDNVITTDREITAMLPRIKMRIRCSVLQDMAEIPETVMMDGISYEKETLLKAILETGKVIYKVEREL